MQTSTKWKERKESLDSLLSLLEAPKLEDGRYHELISSLGKVRSSNTYLFVFLATHSI
jgi:cytoskeleton-associated protein 5